MSQSYTSIPLVVIVDPSEADRTTAREILVNSGRAHVVGMARESTELGRHLLSDPDIVLLDVGIDPTEIHALIRQIHEVSPKVQIVLTHDPEIEFDLSRAMLAGARGVISKPVSPGELLGVIQDVFESEQLRLRRLEDMAKATAVQGRNGEIITVFSPKGGVGCTTIACNLAIALASITKTKVALVDFSLQFGDVAVLLNLHSNRGIHELMRDIDDLDAEIMENVMVAHPSGVKVLLPPPSLDLVEEVATEGMTAVLKALRKNYDYVIVDTWHSIEDAILAIMDLSNTLLLITTPEVPSLRNTRRLLDLFRERSDLRAKVQIVVNRYPSKSAVGMKEIEHSLNIKPVGTIPSDGNLITTAVNEGVSFLTRPSAAATSMTQLAVALAQPRMARVKQPAEEPENAKKRGPMKLFSKAEGPTR